jgi:hypothetical protein
MSFENYFRASSYTMLASAMLVLMLAEGLHFVLSLSFAAVLVVAWNLEGTRWQLSERAGLVIVLLSIPLFILDWQYQKSAGEPIGRMGVTALAHLIVFLAAVKLLQVKKSRDWVFLYLISFFAVLLAAGLSFSLVFLASLTFYLLCALSTIVAFEIQKAKRSMPASETNLLVPPDSRIFKSTAHKRTGRNIEAARLPVVALLLLVLIFVLALPLFLAAPRSGAMALSRSGGGITNFIGFSEQVTLGEIGSLKRDNAVVMHVRIDGRLPRGTLRWRGVALDEFTGRVWKKSPRARRADPVSSERGLFRLGTTEAVNRLTRQTVFLEHIESPVLFAASRPIAIQGDFTSMSIDAEGSVQSRRPGFDRIIYDAFSDLTEPAPWQLQNDRVPYSREFGRYLQLPEQLDSRVAARANAMVVNAHARNRYDEAKAIETQLQQDFGYTLQMRASGVDPLADFLFNVRAGHCEYFSTAMAVMLRTRGIATRVVNGFLPGEYNEAAGAYTVRQSDAHSWVEVYFPESRSWVVFDPTPTAGRTEPVSTGFAAQLGKYGEALELLWFEHVVGYDKQQQRVLATSLYSNLLEFRRSFALFLASLRQTVLSRAATIPYVVFAVVMVFLSMFAVVRVRRFGWRGALSQWNAKNVRDKSGVDFYERLIALLEKRGIKRESYQTPLEFAMAVSIPDAVQITEAYNRVRFGVEKLSTKERREIERRLSEMETESTKSHEPARRDPRTHTNEHE